jgi:hypothetical protein
MRRAFVALLVVFGCITVAGCSARAHARPAHTASAHAAFSANAAVTQATVKPVLARSSQTDGSPGVSILPASTEVAAGGSLDLMVQVAPPSQGLGAWTIEVQYDPSVLSPTKCATPQSLTEVCNASYNGSTILLAGISANGITDTETLATISFSAVGSSGTSSAVSPVLDSFVDPSGTDIPSPATNSGQISITAPS